MRINMRRSLDLEHGGGVKNSGGARSYTETVERPWKSWLIPTFLVVNIAMFVAVMHVNNCPNNIYHNAKTGVVGVNNNNKCLARFLGRYSFQPLRENPLFGPSSSAMAKLGALEWKRVLHKQGWRLFTCIWLHAGLIHLIVNMCSLALIGIRLEQQCGFVRVGIIYLLSGFGASMVSLLFIQKSLSVGASGALFGLLGAMLSELITNWSLYIKKLASLSTLSVVMFFNLALGMLPHVENFANVGGFLTGFLLGFVLLIRSQYGWRERHNLPADVQVKSKYKTYQIVMFILSSILVIAGFIVGLVQLYFRSMGQWIQ